MSEARISVALAACKGEKYIAEQLSSILAQLSPDDELIVSDDCPGGECERLLREAASSDPRILYFEGPGSGPVKNFEYAVSKTSGKYIFLSDQDDVWLPGKRKAVVRELENGALLVLHDAVITDSELNTLQPSFFRQNGSRPGLLKNIIKNSYMGCCMAFDASLKEELLPFPERLPMHDQYIGLEAERACRRTGRKVVFLDTPYLLHRVHGENVTEAKSSIRQKLAWRLRIGGLEAARSLTALRRKKV